MEATTLEDEARALIRRKMPIVICDGKVPLGGKAWHTKPVNEINLLTLLRQAANPAIGLKMGDYIDIEADSPDEEALVGKLFEGCEVEPTPTYKSTRGKHRIYLGDERLRGIGRAVVHFKNGSGAKLGIRIGADGMAAQSIIPPSPGREWLPGLSLDECKPAKLPDVSVRRILSMLEPPNKGNTLLPLPTQTGDKVIERARKYLAKIPPAVSGQGGHDATFHAACKLVQGFTLERGPALQLLREWNQTCQPPWAEHELEHKIDDALNQPGERGNLLTADSDLDTFVSRTAAVSVARHLTDAGNAKRFTEQHGAEVRYCHTRRKWFVWDGTRWREDTSGEIMRRAKRTACTVYVEASSAPDKEQREAAAKWAAASERRERLAAMIALAESEQPIPIPAESLDAEPWLLNFENGTLELKTGLLREHRREDFLTKICPLEYPTEAGDDPILWLEFLDRIFNGNAQLIEFLKRLVGLSLVGEVLEHVLVICYGAGANGKSVTLDTVCGMLGPDYAMHAPTGLLMVNKSDRHPTELADLHGKRFVAAAETADGGRLSEALVKQLTGGDRIRARRMKEDFSEFKPSHTVVLATNHRPVVRGDDHGIWRRLKLIPFVVTIPDAEQDNQLAQKLRREWPAIIRWAVAGCLEWQHDGLRAPKEVVAATEEYRSDMDVLGEFLQERCIIDRASQSRASDLYHSYKAWAANRGEFVESQKRFGMRLTDKGFTKTPTRKGIVYQGIGLLPVGSEPCE